MGLLSLPKRKVVFFFGKGENPAGLLCPFAFLSIRAGTGPARREMLVLSSPVGAERKTVCFAFDPFRCCQEICVVSDSSESRNITSGSVETSSMRSSELKSPGGS